MSWLSTKIESLDDPGAPTTPTRALDTPFQPSTTKHVLGMYSVNLACDEGETSTVELRSDAVNPPTTVRASAHFAAGAAAGASAAARQELVYVVPPGHYVSLVAAGTGVATIAHQTEMVIS